MRFPCWFLLLALAVPAAAHPGWGLVVTPNGTVYFTDLEQVWKWTPGDGLTLFVPEVHTHHLYLDEAGNLYGEHSWYVAAEDTFLTRYWRASPGGTVVDISYEEAARHYERWDADGNRYRWHTDRAARRAWVSRMSPAAEQFVLAGGPWGYADGHGTDAQFRLFGTVVWGPDSSLYATNDGLVRRLTRDGAVTTVAGVQQGFDHNIGRNGDPRGSSTLGLLVAPNGDVVVADTDQDAVLRIARDGTTTPVLESGFSWTPAGVAQQGEVLYVLEYGTLLKQGRVRVRRVLPGGTVELLAETR